MRYLLDTHVWLWWMIEPWQLSERTADLIADTENEILVSVVSIWEVSIKWRTGKLELPEPPEIFVPSRLQREQFSVLNITAEHAIGVAGLPDHHKDPFDRLLIAQSQAENLPLLSADPLVSQYNIKVLW